MEKVIAQCELFDKIVLEGLGLGSISVKSKRAPKQAIQVTPSVDQISTNTLSSLADLKVSELIYDAIIKVDDIERKKEPMDEEEKEEL